MIDFNKNELINKVLENYYVTFSQTLDTCDYVPDKFNDKILRYIYKNMRKKFKEIDKEDKRYKKELKQKEKELIKKTNQKKASKLKIFLGKIFKKKKVKK